MVIVDTIFWSVVDIIKAFFHAKVSDGCLMCTNGQMKYGASSSRRWEVWNFYWSDQEVLCHVDVLYLE